jgi:hypothetical protein
MKKTLLIMTIIMVALGSFLIGRLTTLPLENDEGLWNEPDLSYENLMVLSNQYLEESMSTDDYEAFFSLHQEMIALSIAIKNEWSQFKTNRISAQGYRDIIKENQMRLSVMDRIETKNDLEHLKQLRDQFSETKGLTYQRLYDLRETFNSDHMEIILSTYQEVILVLADRLNLLEQANQTMVKLNARLVLYIES